MDKHVYDLPDHSTKNDEHMYAALSKSRSCENSNGEYTYVDPISSTVRQQAENRFCVLERKSQLTVSFSLGLTLGVVLTLTGFLLSTRCNCPLSDEDFKSQVVTDSRPPTDDTARRNKSFITPTTYQYTMIRDVIGDSPFEKKFITFAVKACYDAYITLTSSRFNDFGPLIEVGIGVQGNSRSAIRLSKLGINLAAVGQPMLSCHSYKQFWIDWENRIRIGLGSNLQENEIMSIRDDRALVFLNIGISTGWGASGEWIFF